MNAHDVLVFSKPDLFYHKCSGSDGYFVEKEGDGEWGVSSAGSWELPIPISFCPFCGLNLENK